MDKQDTLAVSELLLDGIIKLDLQLNLDRVNKLLSYMRLLLKWNKFYSLTSITDQRQIVTHHLLDALTVIPHINNMTNIIDVGSGMGVPGIIIAICSDQQLVTALDSNKKKTAFLQQAAIELNLKNLLVVTSKVEMYNPELKFDLVISRAFASLASFVKLSDHLLKRDGAFLAMKSKNAYAEALSISHYNITPIEVKIPGLDLKRVLMKIERK